MPGLAAVRCSPVNSGGSGSPGSGCALGHAGRAAGRRRGSEPVGRERDERQLAGRPDEPLDLLAIGRTRELDDDPVGPVDRHDRLGHAGGVHAPLDDVADRRHRCRVGRLAVDREGLVLDPETALEVEPELGLDDARPGGLVAEDRQFQAGPEVDRERKQADDDDEDGDEATHRGGLYQRPARWAVRRLSRLA